MFEYARPSMTRIEFSIVKLTIAANNFKIEPNIIQMVQQFVQFNGLQDEDLNAHITIFLEVYNIFNINRVTNDAIKLMLFPF